jgi:hypothetical protein
MNKIDHIVNAILYKRTVTEDISLDLFRDIYNRIKGISPEVAWIIIFVFDQVIVQPLGLTHISLIVTEKRAHFYSIDDFNFIDAEKDIIYGTYSGSYTFGKFIQDVFSTINLIIFGIIFIMIFVVVYAYMKPNLILNISGSILQAMSIFLSIFIFFVISINPNENFRFFSSGRYYKLAQSDKYIGSIGAFMILFAIISSAIASAFNKLVPNIHAFNIIRFLQSLTLSISITGALILFWLVINYHFRRSNEINSIIMAKLLLQDEQHKYVDVE